MSETSDTGYLPLRRGAAAGLDHHLRYGLAMLGPISTAGSQFLLSLQLLHGLNAVAFGGFSFLMVVSAFCTGLWSALFCAPMPVLLSKGAQEERAAMLRCLLSANLAAALLALLAFLLIGILLGIPPQAAMLFAVYVALMLLRWFARAHAYVAGAQGRVVACDIAYGSLMLCCVALLHATGRASLVPAYCGLLAAAGFSLLPFGANYLKRQFLHVSLRDLAGYGAIWRTHSSWSLIGVVTTEATANAHAYIVTLVAGPAAFAVVAASALLIRPVGVAMNALTDFERPRMARAIADGARGGVLGLVRFFRLALVMVWLATLALSVTLMVFDPRLVFPAHYRVEDIVTGGVLWLVIAGVRLMRTPESTMLQAAGQFRPLAHASIWSCGASVAAVGTILALGGPLWSIAGILLGEIVFALLVGRQARRWRRAEDVGAPTDIT